MTTHILEILKANAHLILTRQDVHELLEHLKKDQPVLVEEVVPNILSLGIVENVLKNLLQERVPIRNLSTIMETLADYGSMTKDSFTLTEYVRQSLSEIIVKPYLDSNNVLHAITLGPEVEELLSRSLQELQKANIPSGSEKVALPPEILEKIYTKLSQEVEQMIEKGFQSILVTPPDLRGYFRRIVVNVLPSLIILSYGEIPAYVQIDSVGRVRLTDDS